MCKSKNIVLNIMSEKTFSKEKSIIRSEAEIITRVINELWGFKAPRKIDIYIGNSILRYCFRIYPWYKKIYMFSVLFPFWYIHVRKAWKFLFGIVNKNTKKGHPCILIRPTDVENNFDLADLIFEKNMNSVSAFRNTFYQLMTHVSCHLKLPMWFKEGLAILTKEKAIGVRTVKKDTIDFFKDSQWSSNTVDALKESKLFDVKVFAYNYAKGYWTIKYLEENYPGYSKELFQEYDGNEIIKKIGKKLGLPISDKNEFYKELDLFLYDHYAKKLDAK